MKAIITEDIIRNVLNESIDEFMLEEELMNEINWGGGWNGIKKWWNNGNGQYIKNGLSSAWKNAKNAAAMYMDNRTGGKWNEKYNIHATGNSTGIGHHYFNKWLEYHHKQVYDMVWGNYYGNRQCFYDENGYQFSHDWKQKSYKLKDRYYTYVLKLDRNGIPYTLEVYNNKGLLGTAINSGAFNRRDNSYDFNFRNKKFNKKIYVREDNTTPEEYIVKYCTPQNFERSTKNTLEDGNYKQAVIRYLRDKVQKENPQLNDKQRLELLTMESFYGWWGKNMKNQQAEQPGRPQSTVPSTEQGQEYQQEQGENVNFKFNPERQNNNHRYNKNKAIETNKLENQYTQNRTTTNGSVAYG